FRSTFPNAIGENGAFDVVPMGEALVANVRKSLYVLLGAVGFVLLIAWRVLLFTIIVSLITGILFGLIPALTSARTDLSATFKEGSARSGSGFRQNRARSVLIVTEIALALVLLVGSALFIRTAVALSRVDPGFDARSVLTMRMSFGEERFTSSMAVEQAIRDGVQRVETIPGVELASATCCVPLQGGYGLPFTIAGRPLTNGPYSGGAAWTTVSPGYFEVFRIPVKRGRTFTDRDDANGTPVAIINEAMVREFWPDGNAIGAHITIGRGVMKPFATEPEREIIGVVGDTRDGGLNNDPQPQMFVPQAQIPDAVNALNTRLAPMAWVVRTRTEPLALSKAIQEQLRQATGLPVSSITSMDDVVHASTSRQRFNMWVMTVFAASALVLATIGIYGLMAYTVEQRTQEIGIRLALGADGSRVKNMVVLQGMRLVLVGVVVGVAASFGLTHIIATFLFGVAPWDPLVLVGVPLLLTTVALIAVWWPARRASQVDPLNALRYE
ncbi:MAG TPA: FtsX-like permease family protein, partial [Gemmatimonadaceae bacterium]